MSKTTTNLSSQLNEVYGRLYEKQMNEYLDKYGYERVRVLPKSKVRRLKQYLKLEPKQYRNKAQPGYKMDKDWLGMPMQVKQPPQQEPSHD